CMGRARAAMTTGEVAAQRDFPDRVDGTCALVDRTRVRSERQLALARLQNGQRAAGARRRQQACAFLRGEKVGALHAREWTIVPDATQAPASHDAPPHAQGCHAAPNCAELQIRVRFDAHQAASCINDSASGADRMSFSTSGTAADMVFTPMYASR